MSDENTTTDAAEANAEGRVVLNALTTKDFISKGEAVKFGVNEPVGTVKWLGTIIGKAIGGKEKITVQSDGKPSRSFQFEGMFEGYIYDTDETKTARGAFLPGAFSTELEMTLAKVKSVEGGENNTASFAIEVGIEATGRTIPYTYVVRAYGKQAVDLLEDVRRQLPQIPGRRQGNLALATPKEAISLTVDTADGEKALPEAEKGGNAKKAVK